MQWTPQTPPQTPKEFSFNIRTKPRGQNRWDDVAKWENVISRDLQDSQWYKEAARIAELSLSTDAPEQYSETTGSLPHTWPAAPFTLSADETKARNELLSSKQKTKLVVTHIFPHMSFMVVRVAASPKKLPQSSRILTWPERIEVNARQGTRRFFSTQKAFQESEYIMKVLNDHRDNVFEWTPVFHKNISSTFFPPRFTFKKKWQRPRPDPDREQTQYQMKYNDLYSPVTNAIYRLRNDPMSVRVSTESRFVDLSGYASMLQRVIEFRDLPSDKLTDLKEDKDTALVRLGARCETKMQELDEFRSMFESKVQPLLDYEDKVQRRLEELPDATMEEVTSIPDQHCEVSVSKENPNVVIVTEFTSEGQQSYPAYSTKLSDGDFPLEPTVEILTDNRVKFGPKVFLYVCHEQLRPGAYLLTKTHKAGDTCEITLVDSVDSMEETIQLVGRFPISRQKNFGADVRLFATRFAESIFPKEVQGDEMAKFESYIETIQNNNATRENRLPDYPTLPERIDLLQRDDQVVANNEDGTEISIDVDEPIFRNDLEVREGFEDWLRMSPEAIAGGERLVSGQGTEEILTGDDVDDLKLVRPEPLETQMFDPEQEFTLDALVTPVALGTFVRYNGVTFKNRRAFTVGNVTWQGPVKNGKVVAVTYKWAELDNGSKLRIDVQYRDHAQEIAKEVHQQLMRPSPYAFVYCKHFNTQNKRLMVPCDITRDKFHHKDKKFLNTVSRQNDTSVNVKDIGKVRVSNKHGSEGDYECGSRFEVGSFEVIVGSGSFDYPRPDERVRVYVDTINELCRNRSDYLEWRNELRRTVDRDYGDKKWFYLHKKKRV